MKGARCETCHDFSPQRKLETPPSVFGPRETWESGWGLTIKHHEAMLDFCSWACLAAYAAKCARDESDLPGEASPSEPPGKL